MNKQEVEIVSIPLAMSTNVKETLFDTLTLEGRNLVFEVMSYKLMETLSEMFEALGKLDTEEEIRNLYNDKGNE